MVKLRVMLIGLLEATAQTMRGRGHEIAVLPDAISALRRARSTTADVVILDLAGVDGDPFDLARGIRENTLWRKPMFLVLADSNNRRLDERCREAGIDLIFYKPVDPCLILGFLDRLQGIVHDFESFDPVI